jgi:hypothetical protein
MTVATSVQGCYASPSALAPGDGIARPGVFRAVPPWTDAIHLGVPDLERLPSMRVKRHNDHYHDDYNHKRECCGEGSAVGQAYLRKVSCHSQKQTSHDHL